MSEKEKEKEKKKGKETAQERERTIENHLKGTKFCATSTKTKSLCRLSNLCCRGKQGD
jgi:hypothetical protein